MRLPAITDNSVNSQKDPRKEVCHTKEGINAMPRAKPEKENPSGKLTNEEKARRAGLLRPKKCWNKDQDH